METVHTNKMFVFAVLAIAVVGSIFYLNSQKAPRDSVGGKVDVKTTIGKDKKAARYPVAKEITTPDGFINTDGKPITIGEFVGKKIVLLDIWTYSCINCQRTTPYLNAWYEKYKDKGLVIIGLHTPEFEFEKVYQNVLEATKRLGIKYPVVLDNDYSTWNAYQNRFWPRKYLIDIDGYIVYDHIGEGAYEETEKKIQEALSERMSVLGENGEIGQSVTKEVPIFGGSRSPEIYFGALRNQLFGNGPAGVAGNLKGLTVPVKINTNTLYLSGDWNIANEFSENKSSQAKIVFRYQARDVYFVASSVKGVKLKIMIDGKEVGRMVGEDVVGGIVTVKEDRLYKLIQDQSWGEHTLEIIIDSPGLKAYTFTFG